MTSKHYNNKRYRREKFIKNHLGGDGEIIDSFVVDKNHPMGKEVHKITDNGIIIIYNLKFGKLVTKLIAREKQIERYYANSNKSPPKWLLDLARWHESLGYNSI